MPQPRALFTALLLLFLTTTGCAFFQHLDNSTSEDLRRFKASREELINEAVTLERELADYQRRLEAQQAEANRINNELVSCKGQAALAGGQEAALQKTISDLKLQLQQVREVPPAAPAPTALPVAPPLAQAAPAAPPARESVATSAPLAKEAGPAERKLKIKVLAGDGKRDSAERLAKKLALLKYRVARIDQAPSANFRRTTIFFAAGAAAAAANLARQLGEGAVSRPLTWPSAFDLIVVTGPPS